MKKEEIRHFIEEMEEIGDEWEEDDVKRVYSGYSLEDALEERKAEIGTLFDIIGKVINRK